MNIRQLSGRIEPAPEVQSRASPPGVPSKARNGPTFAEVLRRSRVPIDRPGDEIKISTHAQQRIAQRSIAFGDDEKTNMLDAMKLLEEKGAADALLLRDDAAFIVNVPTRTIVTALGRDELKQRIFTQIDSACLL